MRPDQITVILFCLLLSFMAILFLVLPQSPFSATEKRALQTAPRVTLASVVSGRFGKETDDWYADQFPFRGLFVTAKAVMELAGGKGENNGILIGAGEQLARARFDIGTEAESDRIDEAHLIAAANGVNRAAANALVPTVFLFPGRSVDVAQSAFDYPTLSSDRLFEIWNAALDPAVIAPDVTRILRERYENGEAVIYRTDHHWTMLGAYDGYCEVMRAFGMERDILPMSEFTPVTLTESFSGTFRTAGGMNWITPDRIELLTRADDGDYTVIADGKRQDGFYVIPPEGEAIGYEVFLGGTHDIVTIEKRSVDARPKLLILRDSFADSIAPFLARHFDLILLNLSSVRNDYTDLTGLSEAYQADYALVVYTLSNVLTSDAASRLR